LSQFSSLSAEHDFSADILETSEAVFMWEITPRLKA